MSKKVKVAVLVSGGGTNLQALLDAKTENAEIALVVSSNKQAYALVRAANVGVKGVTLDFSSLNVEAQLTELLNKHGIQLIVLAGFLPILSKEFTSLYPYRILNVHPSLIPKYCGKGFYGIKVHRAVLKGKESFSGATVHYVNEITDGGEIIIQKTVDVLSDDTAETLQKRVMEQAEHVILPLAVEQTAANIVKKIAPYGKDTCGDVAAVLAANSYHGRGIIAGLNASGTHAVLAYFISGRSANSRNRVFVANNSGFTIKPYDCSKVDDPSLILYSPIARLNGEVILTNGDQTDTIYRHLRLGDNMLTALYTREYEPDAPNFTPRISCLLQPTARCYTLALLSRNSNGECDRTFYRYPLLNGCGRFICTYAANASPLPSFKGTPRSIAIPDDIEQFTDAIWQSLDCDNKISLYVEYLSLNNGERNYRILNKYGDS